jgi:phospholipid/cholesterol/gamma-HCH transport system substrate-binding protein
MKLSREYKIGLFGAVTLSMLYFGFNFLKGKDFLSKTKTYYVIFDQVGSLQPANPVKLNGVKIGSVKHTEILQNRNSMVLVTLDVDSKITLRKGTLALLTSELLGASTIMVTIPKTGAELVDGDTLESNKEKGIQALIQEKALPVLRNVDSLAMSLNKTVRQFDGTAAILNKMLATADKTAGGVNMLVNANEASIALILKNLNTLSAALIETEKGFKPILGNLKTTTDSLKALQLGKTLNEANEAIASLQKTLSNLENGKGTAGKLLKDETLYNNLNRTMVSVNQLMTNFREYPKRYVSLSVFGKKDKGPAVSVLDTAIK